MRARFVEHDSTEENMRLEASQAISDRDYEALRSYAGVAPVTRQSGNKKTVMMRRGSNNRLRNAVYHRCRVATISDERAETITRNSELEDILTDELYER
jgi:transposase